MLEILCLEDSADDYGLMLDWMRKSGLNCNAVRVETKREFLHALTTSAVDVVLSDHALADFDSMEALRLLRNAFPCMPFIVVTGAVSEEFAVQCLKRGADDYVLKRNLERLPSAIENALKSSDEKARTIKLASELARRNEELSKLNKELDTFVYSVSHNLRAPMKSLLGLLNLSRRAEDAEAIGKYHDMMGETINRLDDDLQAILEHTRSTHQELEVERVDIAGLINETFESIMFMPGFNQLTRDVSVQAEAAFFGDSYRISSILGNLISNAVKYRDVSKARQFLKIRVKIDRANLKLVVADNGIGIEPDQLPLVFKMFSRATVQSDGAGLGLYIVKEVIGLLGGEIDVSSEPGAGSVFTACIPNSLQFQQATT